MLLTLADVVENERFVDEARMNGVVLRTMHHVQPLGDGRVRLVYRMEITGDGADEIGPRIGPAITADWPVTLRALARAAGKAE